MNPLKSDRNFTPTFTGELFTKDVEGVAAVLQSEAPGVVEDGEMLIEQLLVAGLLNESTTLGV